MVQKIVVAYADYTYKKGSPVYETPSNADS